MMERISCGRSKKLSNASMAIKADSDSCDSAAQKDLSGTNSAWESEGKKKLKKKTKSFSKGIRDFINNNSSNNDKNNNSKLKNQRQPVIWEDLYKSPTFDILEENDKECVEDSIPKLPKGKRMVDTMVGTDVDTLYKSVFGNDTFFEIVNSKAYEEFRNYECSEWTRNRNSGLMERRMTYQLSKTIAFTQHHVNVKQTQVLLSYSTKGFVYGVDTITENTGVAYSDYFRLNIHYRFLQTEEQSLSQLIVIADIEFVKPCLFKGRIESEAWSGLKKYYDIVSHEVQLDRDLCYDEADSITYSKFLKDSFNYKRLGSINKCSNCSKSYNNTSMVGSEGVYLSQEVLLVSFLLVILILVMLTVSLYKMNSIVTDLDDRLLVVEKSLEANERFFQLIIQRELKIKQSE